MPMKGRFPIRRTLQYLSQGDVVFKDTVKVMTVNYNIHGPRSEGARSAVITVFTNLAPKYHDQVLVDVEEKTNTEITQHIKKILGKSEKMKLRHPATFGPRKYHLRECMCEIEGQIPCPGRVPLPKEMTGKYKAAMKDSDPS
uniref:Uncharacterized protein n=1 Tax=Anolis carolinensis TaxID=28377 RepID=G1KM30_ANOCA